VSDAARLSRKPTFNHVALSVPAETLDAAGREALLRFYGEVFGFDEMPTMTEDRVRLVLRAHDNEQFVYLVADPEPMRCPRLDHFGMSVGTPADLHGMLERAKKLRESDPRVEVVEACVEDFGVVKLHNFYVRYLLPMMIEVQCFEWAHRPGDQGAPRD
jgi:hypothetical protein